MRRASELGCIERIIQVGQRAVASARPADYEAALAAGVKFVSPRLLHAKGIGQVLDLALKGANLLVTFDCDALDPSIVPAVIGPSAGRADLLAGDRTHQRRLGKSTDRRVRSSRIHAGARRCGIGRSHCGADRNARYRARGARRRPYRDGRTLMTERGKKVLTQASTWRTGAILSGRPKCERRRAQHVDKATVAQTLPAALEWLWKGYPAQ